MGFIAMIFLFIGLAGFLDAVNQGREINEIHKAFAYTGFSVGLVSQIACCKVTKKDSDIHYVWLSVGLLVVAFICAGIGVSLKDQGSLIASLVLTILATCVPVGVICYQLCPCGRGSGSSGMTASYTENSNPDEEPSRSSKSRSRPMDATKVRRGRQYSNESKTETSTSAGATSTSDGSTSVTRP